MEEYEKRFAARNDSFLHVPRIQIVILNSIEKEKFYVHPHIHEIGILFGDFNSVYPSTCENEEKSATRNEEERTEQEREKKGYEKTDEEIREIDRANLLQDKGTLLGLADSLFGKTEIDIWYIIRGTLCWKVSQTPIRLLTQLKR